MAREVQITCPQCGQTSGHIETEASDFSTGNYVMSIQIPWKCPTCGYPEVKWSNMVN